MKTQTENIHFLYQNGKLTTIHHGQRHRAIFRAADIPLAEQLFGNNGITRLLAGDDKHSIFTTRGPGKDENFVFTPYGHDSAVIISETLSAFNGERIDALTASYVLGNGYRLFSPKLMRFHSPDSYSPFDKGGLNAYAYCDDDPINKLDPSGHASFGKGLKNIFTKRVENKINKLATHNKTVDSNNTAYRNILGNDRKNIPNLLEFTGEANAATKKAMSNIYSRIEQYPRYEVEPLSIKNQNWAKKYNIPISSIDQEVYNAFIDSQVAQRRILEFNRSNTVQTHQRDEPRNATATNSGLDWLNPRAARDKWD